MRLISRRISGENRSFSLETPTPNASISHHSKSRALTGPGAAEYPPIPLSLAQAGAAACGTVLLVFLMWGWKSVLFFSNVGSVHFYLGAQLDFSAVEFDGLIDGFDIRDENFIFWVFSFLAVELLSQGGESFDFVLCRLCQHSELVHGVDLVLDQEFELFLITVKLDNLRHIESPFPGRGRGSIPFPQPIEVMIIQRPKTSQFLGLASHFISPSGGPYWLMIKRRLLMYAYPPPDCFLGIVIPQGFEPDKPFFPGRSHRYVLAQLDLIALFFQVADKVLKQE